MSNHLDGEPSPYLRQHANNPVDWHPWGKLALDKAVHHNKPIFLSIGYSACHWCHVMRHESFERPDIAQLLNDHYIAIKVDREERPDLDKIYQSAHSLLTNRPGGWPLSVFMTPDRIPFFCGTYFPPESRHGLPGFKDILVEIHDLYQNRQEDIQRQNQQAVDILRQIGKIDSTSQPPDPVQILPTFTRSLFQLFDTRHGGFGQAPKFPQSALLNWLIYEHHRHPDIQQALWLTLTSMADHGLFDHLEGGFFRYCTDAQWHIPHFEKMLYDNAQLIVTYAQAYALRPTDDFAMVIHKTLNWSMQRMSSPDGGFYSTMDADSNGLEGGHYLWTRQEIEDFFEPSDAQLVFLRFGMDQPPNFENHWHLLKANSLENLSQQTGLSIDTVRSRLTVAEQKMLQQRNTRDLPTRDTKILTSWNALMIKALIKAAHVLQYPEWTLAADRCLDYLYRRHWQDSQLFSTVSPDGKPTQGFLDDYAFLLDALLETLAHQFSRQRLQWAIEIANGLLTQFVDDDNGGFYFTAHDQEPLLFRPKSFADDSLPSGNAMAARGLYRLGLLTGNPSYLVAADKTIEAGLHSLHEAPTAHASLFLAALEIRESLGVLILRGNNESLFRWHRILQDRALPRWLIIAVPDEELTGIPAIDKPSPPEGREVLAYPCFRDHCASPLESLDACLEFCQHIQHEG